MKITQTRKTEEKIVEIYYKGKQPEDWLETINAKKTINYILSIFSFISTFLEEDHVSIVKQLYFSDKNIIKIGVREMSKKVFIPERTLQVYRRRYCELISMIIDEEFIKVKN